MSGEVEKSEQPEEEKKPHGNTGRKHRNYYTGKKMDYKKFEKGYNLYACRAVTKEECAKIIGITVPTLNKHLNTLWSTGELKGVFTDPNKYIYITGGNQYGF